MKRKIQSTPDKPKESKGSTVIYLYLQDSAPVQHSSSLLDL